MTILNARKALEVAIKECGLNPNMLYRFDSASNDRTRKAIASQAENYLTYNGYDGHKVVFTLWDFAHDTAPVL